MNNQPTAAFLSSHPVQPSLVAAAVYAGEMEVSSKSLQRIARARASSTRSLMSHETPSASHQILMHLSACKNHQTPAPATFPATATTRPSSSTEGAQAVRPLVIARGLPSPIPVFWVCEQENLLDLVPRDRKKGAAGETDQSLLRNVFETLRSEGKESRSTPFRKSRAGQGRKVRWGEPFFCPGRCRRRFTCVLPSKTESTPCLFGVPLD